MTMRRRGDGAGRKLTRRGEEDGDDDNEPCLLALFVKDCEEEMAYREEEADHGNKPAPSFIGSDSETINPPGLCYETRSEGGGSGTRQISGRNRQQRRPSREDMVRVENALESYRREMEVMEGWIHWENERHMENMKRAWERYWYEVEAEKRRHDETVTAIGERYQIRVSALEDMSHERGLEIVSEGEVVREGRTAEVEIVERVSVEDMVGLERDVWDRAEDLLPEGSSFDAIEEVVINGQEVQVSRFAEESNVDWMEVKGDAILCVGPRGVVSAVAGRVSGYAMFGRHSLSRAKLVEILEKLGEDKVVALYLPIGPLSETSEHWG